MKDANLNLLFNGFIINFSYPVSPSVNTLLQVRELTHFNLKKSIFGLREADGVQSLAGVWLGSGRL